MAESEHKRRRQQYHHSGQGESLDNAFGPPGPALIGQPSSADRLATKCIGKSLLLITSTVEQRDSTGAVQEVLQVFLEGHHDLKGIFADQVEGNADLWSIKPEFYTKLADAHFKNTKQEEYKNISDNLSKCTRDELVEHITKLLRDWVDTQPVDPTTGRRPSSKQPFKYRPIPEFWPEGVTYSSDAVHNRANKQQLTCIAEHLVKWKLQRLDLQHLGPAAILPAPPPPPSSLQDIAASLPSHDEHQAHDAHANILHPAPHPESSHSLAAPADIASHKRLPDTAPSRALLRQPPTAGAAEGSAPAATGVMLGLHSSAQDEYPASTRPAAVVGQQMDEPKTHSDVSAPHSKSHPSSEQRGMQQATSYSSIPLFQRDSREPGHPSAPAARRLEATATTALAALRRTDPEEEFAAAVAAAQIVAAAEAAAGGQVSRGHMIGAHQLPPASPGQQ